MKKRLKQALCLCLLTAVLVAALPHTALAASPTFRVSEAAGKPGDTVTVTITVENNPGIVALRLFMAYDGAVLELLEAKEGVLRGMVFGPLTNNPLATTWIQATSPNNSTNGVVVTLTFRIRENAPAGKSAVTASVGDGDALNEDMEEITFATVAGGVTVGGDNPPSRAAAHSVTEVNDAGRGLAFLFTVPAKGVALGADGAPQWGKATLSYNNTECAVLRVGALLTADSGIGSDPAKMVLSAAGVTNVPVSRLWKATSTTCSYVVRLQNIPSSATQKTVYARPYYVIRYNGVETVVYGAIDATSYAAVRA